MIMLLRIFETRIFPLHKVNFMQYLPLYVISLGSESSDPDVQARCKSFSERLLSFFIFNAFNFHGKKNPLAVRQHSWNYLASLLCR